MKSYDVVGYAEDGRKMRTFHYDDAVYVLRVTFANIDQNSSTWSDEMHKLIGIHCGASGVAWPGEGIQIAMIEAGRKWFDGIPTADADARHLYALSVPNTAA